MLIFVFIKIQYKFVSNSFSIVEQTYTTAEFVSQAIDINEPVGNLKKLLEPRLQCSLEAHEICLQDIQVKQKPKLPFKFKLYSLFISSDYKSLKSIISSEY